MKILFVASEATPLAKTGGLADVVGSLPKELARQGHDVRIVIPRYRQTTTAAQTLSFAGVSGMIACGPDMEEARLFESAIDDVPVYLVAHDGFFDRDHLYGDPSGDYPDNDRRFSFFCRAVSISRYALLTPYRDTISSLSTTVPVSDTAPAASSGLPGKPIFLTIRMSSGHRRAIATSQATVTPPRGSPSTITSALSR